MSTMTLPEFFTDVACQMNAMREAGLVTVYFQHETITPGNVRFTWEDHPIREVPEEGDLICHPHAGYWGTPARWHITKIQWLAGPGVIAHCASFAENPAAPWLGWVQGGKGHENVWTRVTDDGSRGITIVRERKTRNAWRIAYAFQAGGEQQVQEYSIKPKVSPQEAQEMAMAFTARH